MDHLLDRIEALEQHVQTLRQQTTSMTRRLRWWRRLACSLAVLTVFGLPLSLGARPEDEKAKGLAHRVRALELKLEQVTSEGLAQRVRALERKLAQVTSEGLAQPVRALEQKLQHVTSVIGPDGFPELVVTGANLRIVNGLGATICGDAQGLPIPDCPNGLGNIIVGYNEARGFEEDIRIGSHNVVLGIGQNFSRVGGLVAGIFNTISGDFAVVSGGVSNTASGQAVVVSGGQGNTASAPSASVSGGAGNTASGFFASVSGGVNNLATDNEGASVSGGVGNTASGLGASVSGGVGNTASGFFASVSGGRNRTAEGEVDWVAGGLFQDE
jgi:hypothetical protein